MEPRPRPPHLPGHQRKADKAARIVRAVNVLADAHAPEDHPRLGPGEGAGDLAQGVGVDAAKSGHLFRREASQMLLHRFEVLGVGGDILLIRQPLFDDDMHDRVQHRDVGARAELQHPPGVALQTLAARVHHDQLAAALGELLEIGRGDRVVFRRVGADDDGDVGVLDLVERGGDGARSDILHQRGDG